MSFAYGCVCCCCAIGQQRMELLDVTGEPYVCCAGIASMPCCPCPDNMPAIPCVWVEAFCCPQMALSANRFIIQSRFGLQNTSCDDCLFNAMGCWLACAKTVVCLPCSCGLDCLRENCGLDLPCSCDDFCAENANECTELANCLILLMNGCMFAQQQAEINKIRGNYNGPSPQMIELLPPKQQAMIQNATSHTSQGVMQGMMIQ